MKNNNTGNKYANTTTYTHGLSYRYIANVLNENGIQIEFAQVKNLTNRALKDILKAVSKDLTGNCLSDDQISALLKDSEFHTYMGEIIYSAYHNDDI